MLRLFVKTTPELEDLTGYSPGYYNRLLDNFIKYGTPTYAEEQDRLRDLIFEAFSKRETVDKDS